MPQVSSRRDLIADELFEFLHFWESALFRSGPDHVIVDANLEHAARRSQRHWVQYSISTRGVFSIALMQCSVC